MWHILELSQGDTVKKNVSLSFQKFCDHVLSYSVTSAAVLGKSRNASIRKAWRDAAQHQTRVAVICNLHRKY